jgi:hypothetical protein
MFSCFLSFHIKSRPVILLVLVNHKKFHNYQVELLFSKSLVLSFTFKFNNQQFKAQKVLNTHKANKLIDVFSNKKYVEVTV